MTDYKEKVREILAERASPPLCCLRSFGCRQNVYDGERILGMLCEMGYGVTEDASRADLILFNTCAVRENAEQKIYGLLGSIKHLKDESPGLIIGVCGCMAQEQTAVEKLRRTYKQVDLIFGTFAIGEFPRLLYQVLTQRGTAVDITEYDRPVPEDMKPRRSCLYRADVPIMYGCDNFCSYCIVPYVRGRERSREPEAVLNEVRELAQSGCREIMLLGQNVNSYGYCGFPELLRRINDIEGDFRVRFMSPHPKDAGPELIDVITGCGKICGHMHLPLQSGSDRILREMNRRYTVGEYLDIVRYAREKVPDFSFSTDIIVGFPGETEEDFQATLDVMREVRYDNIFSFIYSKRTGTKAADMEDVTPPEEKSDRMRRLLTLQREISTEHFKRFIGRELTVLFDGETRAPGVYSGKSDEFIIVEAAADSTVIGQVKKVKITKAYNWALEGTILN